MKKYISNIIYLLLLLTFIILSYRFDGLNELIVEINPDGTLLNLEGFLEHGGSLGTDRISILR